MILEPDLVVDALWQLTPTLLRERGIDGVLVDLDETLLPAGVTELDPRAAGWLERLATAGIAAAILSNGEPARVREVCGALHLRGLALAGKPLPLAYRRGLRRLGTPAARSAMVGDQLFTDVLGANLAGLTSILVRPLSGGGLPHTRLARRLERRLLASWGLAPAAPSIDPPTDPSTDPSHPSGGDRGRSLDR